MAGEDAIAFALGSDGDWLDEAVNFERSDEALHVAEGLPLVSWVL